MASDSPTTALQREREIARLREWQIVFRAALIGVSTVLTMLETEGVSSNGKP